MKIIGVDQKLCISCTECIKECPMDLYGINPEDSSEKEQVIHEDPYNRCNGCGHCIAICPESAILYEDGEPPLDYIGDGDPGEGISYDDLMQILRSRRSVRRYKAKAIPREELEAILDAMRYAPSASNMQSWRYIVLTDPDSIGTLRNAVFDLMNLARKLINFAKYVKFLIPKKLKKSALDPGNKVSLDIFSKKVEDGKDPALYNAPAVIITYAPEYGSMAGNDAGIALTHGMLAARARGLDTCWIGFAQEAINRSKKLKKWLKIPKSMKVNGVIVLGYPAVKYKRAPPRKALKIDWK
ncbi:MAG: nitroreductase family protein [Candidatus Hodarchaeota archaeon]